MFDAPLRPGNLAGFDQEEMQYHQKYSHISDVEKNRVISK